MELQGLQSQLKSAIQNHQIVLSKMRIDPQNTTLQKQLHDLQAEIMALSDKQGIGNSRQVTVSRRRSATASKRNYRRKN